jgi:hypothetical protein
MESQHWTDDLLLERYWQHVMHVGQRSIGLLCKERVVVEPKLIDLLYFECTGDSRGVSTSIGEVND